jgi:hypothetical protein
MFRDLIELCQIEELALMFEDIYIHDRKYSLPPDHIQRGEYFRSHYDDILLQFCRYIRYVRFPDEDDWEYRSFYTDRTYASVVFAFDSFLGIKTQEELDQMIKSKLEKRAL